MNEPFAFYQQSADYVRARMPFEPQIAVILGSSLGPFAGQLQDPVEIDYHEIPNFLTSTAPGHAGKLIFGTLAGKRLVCLSGRFHSYEGYDFEQLTQPVRLLKLLGVRALIVTNGGRRRERALPPRRFHADRRPDQAQRRKASARPECRRIRLAVF